MSLANGDKGQIYTMEGIAASIIILGVLLFVIEANSLVVPQTGAVIDMKLSQTANDVLTTIDWNSVNYWSPINSLTSYVIDWDGNSASYMNSIPDPAFGVLDNNITSMLPDDVEYNLEFIYSLHYENGTVKEFDQPVIFHGVAGDNSVVATRIVTINADEAQSSPYWNSLSDTFPQVVEVKITCWHL
jgi:hypothetical protein